MRERTGSAPTAYVTITGRSLRPNGHTVIPIDTATNKPGPPIDVGSITETIAGGYRTAS